MSHFTLLSVRLPLVATLWWAFCLTALGQSGQNYLKTTVVTVPGKRTEAEVNNTPAADKRISYTYMDGLGRTVQQVEVQASPGSSATTLGYDLVQPVAYDHLGRSGKQYLPYVATTQNGSWQANALTDQAAFYNNNAGNNADKIANDAYPFAMTVFEDSPLQRVLQQGAPGQAWQPGTQPGQGHTLRNQFGVNRTTDQVRIWDAVQGPTSAYYGEGELALSRTTDENGNQVLTFSDKMGRTILKRVQIDETLEGTALNWLDTYYVYDAWSQLTYQVPPKAVVKINAGTAWTPAFIDEWVFSYRYDARNRLVEQKVPGVQVVYFCYDPLDRPVLTQDGRLRTAQKWRFVKYDLLQRSVMAGLYLDNVRTSREAMQAYLDGLDYTSLYYEEKQAATPHGYSNQCFPSAGTEIQLVQYYDDYDFNADGVNDYGYAQQGLSGEGGKGEGQRRFYQGRLTGSKALVLGRGKWLYRYLFYDKYGQVVQSRQNNYVSFSIDNLSTQVYAFDGRLNYRKQFKKLSASLQTTVLDRYAYDLVNRPVAFYQSVNGGSEKKIADYRYNALGQLVDKQLFSTLGSNPVLQSVDYRYQIRGWLTSINNSTLTNDSGLTNDESNDVFGLSLLYEQADATGLTNPVVYNGQLSAVKWQVNDVHHSTNVKRERSYQFSYDKADRLKQALFRGWGDSGWNAEVGAYDEKGPDANGIRYDANGNLLALQRYTLNNGSTSPTLLDDLTYTYTAGSGNQVRKVEDASGNVAGFKNGVNQASEYQYDGNGNLTWDANKVYLGGSGSSLSYNDVNKASKVDLGGGRYIVYLYDGTGTRVRKEVYSPSGGSTPTEVFNYLDGFVYSESSLLYFSMGEGRVRNAGGTLTYEYFLRDQQGNVQVSLEDNGSGVARVTQENHYYAFGLGMQGQVNNTPLPSSANQQRYNGGSELQNEWGFEHSYSTFYREYDPALGRFNAIDPMADQFGGISPYNFAFNDPVNLNDPLGDTPGGDGKRPNQTKGMRIFDSGWSSSTVMMYGRMMTSRGSDGRNYWTGSELQWEMYGGGASGAEGNGGVGPLSAATVEWAMQLFNSVPSNANATFTNGGRPNGMNLIRMNATGEYYHMDGAGNLYVPYSFSSFTTVEAYASNQAHAQLSNYLHDNFDRAGLIPIVGELFDGLNAAMYVMEGEYGQAALSAAAMVPIFGWAATASKKFGQIHHVIPNAVYKNFANRLNSIGWFQNHGMNLKRLPTPFPANHPYYNNYVTRRIQAMIDDGSFNMNTMRALQDEMRQQINVDYFSN